MKDWLTPKETDQQLVSHKILANEHALTDPPLAHHIWCQKTLWWLKALSFITNG